MGISPGCIGFEFSRASLASRLHIVGAGFSKLKYELREDDFMADDNSTGTNMIWAVAMIIIVAIIAGALYYSGPCRANAQIRPKRWMLRCPLRLDR